MWSDCQPPCVRNVTERASYNGRGNAAPFLVNFLHDSGMFTSGRSFTHAARSNLPDEMAYLTRSLGAVRSPRILVIEQIRQPFFQLKTSSLETPLNHWTSF